MKKFLKVFLSLVTIGIIASKAKIIRGEIGGALEKVNQDELNKVEEKL